MKTIFDVETKAGLIKRVDNLNKNSQRHGGKMTTEEVGISVYKPIDHHLRQFAL